MEKKVKKKAAYKNTEKIPLKPRKSHRFLKPLNAGHSVNKSKPAAY